MSTPTFIMTDQEREAWVTDLAKRLGIDFSVKYLRGRREHGADLGAVPLGALIQEAKNEVIDQISYVAEMERRFDILLSYIAQQDDQIQSLIALKLPEVTNGQ